MLTSWGVQCAVGTQEGKRWLLLCVEGMTLEKRHRDLDFVVDRVVALLIMSMLLPQNL